MPILPHIISGFRSLFAKEELDRDLEEELQGYLDLLVREKVTAGMDPEEARAAARRELGGMEQVTEKVRERRIGFHLDIMWQDVRYALRGLRRSLGLTVSALMILTLGIGATTAIFSTVRTVLSGRLPFPESDRLVLGEKYYRTRVTTLGTVSAHDFVDFRERLAARADLAATGSSTAPVIVMTSEGPLAADLTPVSWNLFSTLGVQPIRGSGFRPDDEQGARESLIISHAFWSRCFSADPAVIGSDLDVSGELRTIVGIMPPGFTLLNDADLWVPFRLGEEWAGRRDQHNFLIVGRLLPGISLEQARSEAEAVSRALEQEYPASNTDKALRLEPLHDYMVADVRQTLLLYLMSMGLFLLIACSNVTGLLLARAQNRRPEIAVRSAVGASRSRLVRQLLTESTLITLLAGVMGVVIARIGLALLIRFLEIDRLGVGLPQIDGRAFLFAFVTSILCGFIIGITPAVQSAGIRLQHHLRSSSRSSPGRAGMRARNGLIVFQTAVSIVLLVLTGLFLRSMARMVRVDPGFETSNLLVATIQIPPDDYPSVTSRWEFFSTLIDEIEALPGVVSAGAIDKLPIADQHGDWGVWPADLPRPESSADVLSALTRMILPGYFETMGMPLLTGHDISAVGASDSLATAVINETLAERFWPGEDPVGRIILHGGGRRRIVGVVRDAHLQSLRTEPRLAIYVPYSIWPEARLRLAVRTGNAPESLAEPVRGVLHDLNARALLSEPESFESICDREFAGLNIILCTLGVLAVVCVLLTAIGLYGGLSYQVSRRRNELGIRLALGATPRALMAVIIRSGFTLVGLGLVIGIIAAYPAAGFVRQFLFETGSWDGISYTGAALFLGAVVLLACLLPARRVLRLDPVRALRNE